MIGEVPKGAPLRCKIGKHQRSKDGAGEGLMCYFCPRCKGTYWQDRRGWRGALDSADAAIQAGDYQRAGDITERATGHRMTTDPAEVMPNHVERFGRP